MILALAVVAGFARVARTEILLFSLTADALNLQPATNAAGTITFINQGDGWIYSFTAKRNDGSVTNGEFYVPPPLYVSLADLRKRIDTSFTIGYGKFGQTSGKMTMQREVATPYGSYSITATPLGIVAGNFTVVRFSGLVQRTNTTYSGILYGIENETGTPQMLILGSGTRGDDAVGQQAGMEFAVYLTSADHSVILADQRVEINSAKIPWRFLRGYYATLQNSDLTLSIESSPGAGKPWKPILSIPISTVDTKQLYRLVIGSP